MKRRPEDRMSNIITDLRMDEDLHYSEDTGMGWKTPGGGKEEKPADPSSSRRDGYPLLIVTSWQKLQQSGGSRPARAARREQSDAHIVRAHNAGVPQPLIPEQAHLWGEGGTYTRIQCA